MGRSLVRGAAGITVRKEVCVMAEKRGRMTDRERIEALLRREKPDRVPLWPFAYAGFACVHTGTSIADAYNKPAVSLAAQRKVCQEFGWVFLPMNGYAAYGGWEFGGEIKWPSGEFAQAPTVTRFPVETIDDVWKLEAPEVATAGFVPYLKEFYDLASQEWLDNEPFNVMAQLLGSFNTAGMIAGPDKLCKWVIKDPKAAHRLVRLATDHMIDLIEYWHGLYGIEGVLPFTGEAIATGQLISAKTFEEFVMPYFQEAHKKVLDMGYKHIYSHLCGEQNDNLVHWAKVPFGDPGIISIGHEVELEKAASFFPNDIILGNLEPAIIQTQTADEVYEASRVVIEKGKRCSGGFAFSPGCELPPMAPPENVMAMTRAVNDFGWY
jgi:uroporphyrinogen decarboxylase